MSDYVPIYKSKPAEIWAWNNATATVQASARVLFEVVPTETIRSAGENFVDRLAKGFRAGQVVTVDCGLFGQSSNATTEISNLLYRRNISEIPVFRLTDTPAILNQVMNACLLHRQGACLRLGSNDDDPDPTVTVQEVEDKLDQIELNFGDIDLIIDYRVVASNRDVTRCLSAAATMLAWANACGPWRRVALASGAFPRSISDLQVGTPTGLRRFDAMLYERVIQSNPDIVPDYADYGINYPILGPTPPRAPNPNLRYADGRQWWVDRENRLLPGNASFYTLCQRAVRAPYWAGRSYSAGDGQIEAYARGIGGPGAPTNWLSFGASHHLAHVADRLATLGVP